MSEDARVGEIPGHIRKTLLEHGVEVDDPKIKQAVLLALEGTGGPSFRAALRAYRRGFLRGLTKEMERTAERTARMASRMTMLVVIVGMLSAIASLVSGYESFRESIGALFLIIAGLAKTVSLLGTMAYAQTGIPISVPPTAQLIVPILVYIVYVLFSVGYVVSLFALFFGKQPKDKANAMEVLRNLTAFFIGALSGKAV